jgi:hypothetical protein
VRRCLRGLGLLRSPSRLSSSDKNAHRTRLDGAGDSNGQRLGLDCVHSASNWIDQLIGDRPAGNGGDVM